MADQTDLSKPLKTWSHLAGNKRRPTEYEIVSARMLWNTPNHELPWRMASDTPQIKWIIDNRNGSRLQHPNWDGFRDPDNLVYRTYVLMQDGQESYVDGVLDDYNSNEHDFSLSPEWLETLCQLYTPARFPLHAIQMASGYLVALAPCSTIANAFMMQGGDQLRWVSRIAYRTAELAQHHPNVGFGDRERALWEKGEPWAGFVELAEKALVAWDWGECFTSIFLVMKPAVDEAFLRQFARVARDQGDTLTAMLLDAQQLDSERSRRMVGALVRFLCEEHADNRDVLLEWLDKWMPLANRSIDNFCGVLDPTGAAAASAKQAVTAFHESIDLGSGA